MENSSKIQTGILGFIVLAILVLSIITMSICLSLRSDVKEICVSDNSDLAVPVNGGDRQTTTVNQGAESEEQPICIMKIQDDKVVVLSLDGEVLQTVHRYASCLPEEDRSALIDGIKIYTREKLASLIEDFSH